jgi:intracellular sulfur oxidation DsrE/DsrF family protein
MSEEVKVVIHISTAGEGPFLRAINNAENLEEARHGDLNLHIVANSQGVELLRENDKFDEWHQRLQDLNCSLKACKNSIAKLDVDTDKLGKEVEVIDSGIDEVIKLQERGFHYVNP